MFACDLRTLRLIFLFALMINEIVSSPQIPKPLEVETFKPCDNIALTMEQLIGRPPSQKNYWDGTVSGVNRVTVKLKLTVPANVSLSDTEKGEVDLRNGTFHLIFRPPIGGFQEPLKFHVRGAEDGKFPNIQSLILNDLVPCFNPGRWWPVTSRETAWEDDIEVSNDSEKETEVSNDSEKEAEVSNDSEKDTEISNNETALKCGKRFMNHQGLIKGGELTKEGDWPWHAAIFHQEKVNTYAYKCGGVVLNKNTVLTAAHCVVQSGRFIVAERVSIKLGLYHRFIGGRNTQEFQVFRIIPHENFDFTYLYNDIAVLKLSTEAMYTNYVQPVCLWPEGDTDINSLVGKSGHVIGWGFYDKQNELSDYLGYGTMPIVSSITCLESNRPFFGVFVSSRTFCAGYRNGTSVCNGDSGGGMFFERDGVYLLRGLVSVSVSLRNEQVCDPYEYVLFTDVAQYLDWIKLKL